MANAPHLKLVTGPDSAQGAAWLATLAPEYAESDITTPFPFNAYYKRDRVPLVEGSTYKLELSGLIANKQSWTLEQLRALPQTSQITRHVCVEGWSAIGKWGGVRFRTFLERIGADPRAAYVGFKCADNYYSSIDMATALHPQTLLALTYADQTLPPLYGFPMKLRIPTKLGFKCADDYYTSIDMPTALHPQTQLSFKYAGETLPPKYGFPMKLRIPTKLGFKNPKHIVALFVTNENPGGYWEDKGYNWFSGS